MTAPRRWAAVLAVLMAASGCSSQAMLFIKDTRVHIVQPTENSRHSLPLHLQWTGNNVAGARYALFFDSPPVRPGQSLLSLVDKQDPCRADNSCLGSSSLTDKYVFVTKATHLDVDLLPDRRKSHSSLDDHLLTIVMVDGAGRRIGEAAYLRTFTLDRTR